MAKLADISGIPILLHSSILCTVHLILLLGLLLCITPSIAEKAYEKDRVVNLPGQPSVGFAQYAGYVNVNATHGRALFYWLYEADTNDAASKPLLLWLNGGPGCSSVGYGALEEIGPFKVNSDGATLSLNHFAWNKEANILFLESPAGVGFSYSNTSSDYDSFGDTQTALDAYAFLVGWIEKFPQYDGRDFYIAGESYAGHYIPELAQLIVEMNSRGKKPINLKGILVGNGLIDDTWDTKGIVDFAWSHGIISDSLYSSINKECDFTLEKYSDGCSSDFLQIFVKYDGINIYNIFADVCLKNSSSTRKLHSFKFGSSKIFKQKINNEVPSMRLGGYDPCIDDYVSVYLNRQDVQKALNANTTKIPYAWDSCSDVLKDWSDAPSSMLPILKQLMANGIRVWVFSGDTDGRIPITSTRYSIRALKLETLVNWFPWYHDEQVAGWSEVYRNLTFASVRGAGHMVATFQPQRALALVSNFLKGNQLPGM